MDGIMDLTMKNGRLVLNGHELSGVKEYRICIESGHKMPGTGELEIKMLVNVLENMQGGQKMTISKKEELTDRVAEALVSFIEKAAEKDVTLDLAKAVLYAAYAFHELVNNASDCSE